jgi:hypothetical protein
VKIDDFEDHMWIASIGVVLAVTIAICLVSLLTREPPGNFGVRRRRQFDD